MTASKDILKLNKSPQRSPTYNSAFNPQFSLNIMLSKLILFLIAAPFILGFITYGIRSLMNPPVATNNPVTIKIPAETLKQLKENGYLDPNTGKLKDTAVGAINLEEVKS